MEGNLTGRWCVRAQPRWFRKPLVVMTVEETYMVTENLGYEVDCSTATRWRDATVGDFALLVVEGKLNPTFIRKS